MKPAPKPAPMRTPGCRRLMGGSIVVVSSQWNRDIFFFFFRRRRRCQCLTALPLRRHRMARVLALAACLAAATAACPNLCSGNGLCGANDQCTCFSAASGPYPSRFSYTGADCSQRTCPAGLAFADISSAVPAVSAPLFTAGGGGCGGGGGVSYAKLRVGFNAAARSASFLGGRADAAVQVKVMSTSADPSVWGSFAWKLAGDAVYQAESPLAAAASEGSARALIHADAAGGAANTGLFVWWDAAAAGEALTLGEVALGDSYSFTLSYNDGAAFSEADGNSAHQPAECSSRGACDRATGACACLAGYTGQACERTACANQCSGNGICQSQGRFVTDGGILLPGTTAVATYAAGWDRYKEYGCKCDAGYRGPDCSLMECPSYSDPLGGAGCTGGRDCSGRGVCDYSTGVCACARGFTGDACDTQTSFA